MVRTSAPSVQQFLSAYPPDVRRVAERLRVLVGQAVPEAVERVYPGWRVVGYRVPVASPSVRTAYFGFVAPLADRVWLGFEYGFLLDDPLHLLSAGGGRMKQVRVVEIEPPAEPDPAHLLPLIRQAAELARGQ